MILLTYGKHLLYRIILLKGEFQAHKTSLPPPPPPPLFIEVTVPDQNSERWCICMLGGISFVSDILFFIFFNFYITMK